MELTTQRERARRRYRLKEAPATFTTSQKMSHLHALWQGWVPAHHATQQFTACGACIAHGHQDGNVTRHVHRHAPDEHFEDQAKSCVAGCEVKVQIKGKLLTPVFSCCGICGWLLSLQKASDLAQLHHDSETYGHSAESCGAAAAGLRSQPRHAAVSAGTWQLSRKH